MKNFLHKMKWNAAVVEQHTEPPPIPLIKRNHDDDPDKNFVKLKLRRDPRSEKSDLCEFKMSLFHNGDPEGLLLLVHNFNMTLTASGILETDDKAKYFCTLFM